MNIPGLPADEPGPRIDAADHGGALLADSQLGPPWWAPAPEIVPPSEGTFRFQYRVTGHDDDGSPTITATVNATLRFPPPPPDQPGARPVGRTGIAARLRIPFVDADTGRPTATELPVEAAERDGVVACRVEISGALARAAYGALSTPGFQRDDGAGLIVDTTFTAVQEHEAAWAVAAMPAVAGGAAAALDEAVLADVQPELTVVPVRGWPYEEPPRVEHPIPEEHPEWADVVTSTVRMPDTAIHEAVVHEAVVHEAVVNEAVVQEATVLQEADVLQEAAVLRDATILHDVALLEMPVALPKAGREMLISDELFVDTFPFDPLFPDGGGLDPDGFSPQPESFTIDMAVAVTRQHRVPLLVPCRDHPELYRHDPGGGAEPEVVGCQEAFQLGRIPARRFAPAPRLDRRHRYSVWESLQQPATYLVVPAHYRVARSGTGRPELEWLQVFDATVDVGLPCLLQARCVPDLSPAELAELESLLRTDAGDRDVRILLPSSPSVGSTGVSVPSSTVEGGLRAVLDDDAVRVALRVDYDDAVVVVTQLRGGEAVAQIEFDTDDPRLALGSTLHLDVDELAGPYPDGPIRLTAAGLRDEADTAATVTALWTRSAVGGWSRTALEPPVRIPARGEAALPVPAMAAALAARAVAPEAQLEAADPAQLVVRNVYLENLHTVVLIRRDIDLKAARIASVRLTFTVSGVEVARAVLPAAAPTLEVTLVQPLVADQATFNRNVVVSAVFTADDGSTRPAGVDPSIVDLSAGAIVRLSTLVKL